MIMQTFLLSRDDVRTELHPRMWEDICDALGIGPDTYGDYPENIEITSTKDTTP